MARMIFLELQQKFCLLGKNKRHGIHSGLYVTTFITLNKIKEKF